MPKLIFANLLNELMLAKPEQAYAKNLSPVTVRKIWIAKEGDVVVTPAEIKSDFKNYACTLLGEAEDKILTLSPAGENTTYLAERLQQNEAIFQQVSDRITASSEPFEMLCFANDKPTLDLARKLNVALAYYKELPDESLVRLIYALNMKSGFRHTVEELGFNIPKGVACEGKEALIKNIETLLKSHETIIVKFNRSSNGYGHWIINREQFASPDFQENVDKYLARYQQPKSFVIEEFIDIKAVPSVEMLVDENGPQLLYVCNQRCPHASYSGMVTPPQDLSASVIDKLMQVGNVFGNYVYSKGFRGVFDIDACLDSNNQLYLTETNFRRTAGTFIDSLAKRLIAPDYYSHHVWIQDAKLAPSITSFEEARNLLYKSGLNYAHANKTGVILYADTYAADKKCRYIVFGKDIVAAQAIENDFINLFNLE